MKHWIIIIIFVLFAAVQINDGDYYIWVPLYLFPAILGFLYVMQKQAKLIALVFSLLYFAGVIYYLPEFSNWVSSGLPSITGSMKAESPFIEFVREFFGLVICLTASLYYLNQFRKRRNKKR